MSNTTQAFVAIVKPRKNIWIVAAFSIFLSLIPVFFTLGKLNIGGDVLVPLGADGLEKNLFQWVSIGDGQYYSISYYPFYFLFKVFEFCSLDVYQSASVILFILGIVATSGIYKSCALFSESESYYVYLVPIVFYVTSPALLNGWHYNFIYAFSPWFVFFVFKILKQKEIKIQDVLGINLVFFFCTLELPNPKYVFHLHIIAILILLGGIYFKIIDLTFFKRNWIKFVIYVFLMSYIVLPTAYFTTQYTPENYGVHVKAGYKDSGEMMNKGTDTIDRVLKLHQDNIFLNSKDAASYKSSILVSVASLAYIFIIAISPLLIKFKTSDNKKYFFILLCLLLVYIFFGAGPNPPLGFIYEYGVTNYHLLAFLRTTGGAVFYLSLIYALLLFIILANLQQHKIKYAITFLCIIGIVSYPFFNGEVYKNFNGNHYGSHEESGYKILEAYFRVKSTLDSLQLDAKIYYLNSDLIYLNTKWGFFGPVIYNFIYKQSNIGFNKVKGNPAAHNVGFTYQDNSLFGQEHKESIKTTPIINDEFIKISRTSRNEFLPHIYIPTQLLTTEKPEQIQSACDTPSCLTTLGFAFVDSRYFSLTNLAASKSSIAPHLEFRKINSTKYRVRVHSAGTSLPLVFSETNNPGWRVYAGSMWSSEVPNNNLSSYKIFDGNKEDQASVNELQDYYHRGLITSLGDGNEKTLQHKQWMQGREIPSYSEKYRIAFISKDFKSTIQNNNLPSGHLYETWLKKNIAEATHFTVNGYANGWVVDVAKLCAESQVCRQNDDGTFDMELIIEFWPQQVYYLGIFITALTLFGSLGIWLRHVRIKGILVRTTT